jgi:hypothetical protein
MATDDFDPQSLLAAAERRAGVGDFGPDDFREPLEILCRSLASETPLTPEGRAAQRERVIGLLEERATLYDWLRRHPEIADEDIGQPVVIAGLPRTGTTLLYRMLSATEGLAPPAGWDLTGADPRIAAGQAAVADMMRAMPDLASIYPYEAMAPEESIYIYRGSFISTQFQAMALIPSYDLWFKTADKRPAYRYLRLAVRFLQWQRRKLGRHQEGVRWLLKTPDHLHGFQELLDVFPGAHIIQTHRDPIQTIPSICSFIRVLHSPTTARDDSVDIGQAWSRMFANSMTAALAVRERNPGRFLDIWYRDTVADPRKVADEVFAFIGQPLTDAGWEEMQRWREANRREERPAHSYTLEEFGLSEERIRTDFRAYRERFIERGPATAA